MSKFDSLLSNEHFLSDLRDTEVSNSQLAQRWGTGKTWIQKQRTRLAKGALGSPVSPSEAREVLTAGTDGSRSVEAVRNRPVTLEDAREWVRSSGDDPADFNISIKSIAYGVDLFSNKMSATPKPGRKIEEPELSPVDLPLLYSQAEKPVTRVDPTFENRSLVVVWADIQVGKTGSRGGTPELIQRINQKRAALQDYMASHYTNSAYFLSVGDEVESFENVPAQAFTNDLSFPQQLDLELTFELDFVRLLAQYHDSVTVAGVSSNHCRWRSGKNVLGKPSDDYGIYLKHQLEKSLRINPAYDHVAFEYPNEWDETMALDVQGTTVGMAHGHQVNRPDGIEQWWTKQAFGKQAIANADILLTGHFHTPRVQAVGERWWLQASTLDNGSDWYRNLSGSDSKAGLMVFCIDENGFDLSSLAIL